MALSVSVFYLQHFDANGWAAPKQEGYPACNIPTLQIQKICFLDNRSNMTNSGKLSQVKNNQSNSELM